MSPNSSEWPPFQMDEDITESTPVQIVWDINQLLKEWKLENILPHLRAEKVDAEILEMIKVHHIRMLLCNFPLGVQIRFEYHLEQWRYTIGKPLHVHKCCESGGDFMSKQSYDKVLTRLHPENTILIPSQQQPHEQQHIKVLQIDSTTTNIPTPQQSPETTSAAHVVDVNNTTTPPGTPTTKDVSDTITPSYSSKPYTSVPTVDLREILLKSKPEGPQILKIYSLRKSFLKTERKRLLNLIATYYLRNKLRFDLHTSYVLEAAILKMFPNERLDMYRTSRRGSLYCKYMKAKKLFLKHNHSNALDYYLPEDDDMVESSDMEALAVTDDAQSVAGGGSDEYRVGSAATIHNESVNMGASEEFMAEEGNSVITKIEVEVEIPIQTAYRLHREVITLTNPFSYQDFLSKACNVYGIPDVDNHYLAVNDCEISEIEFKNVLMQYYKLTTFVVEVKQKSSLVSQLNDNGSENYEETIVEIDPNHLPDASQIRNIASLLHVVALSDASKPLENRHRNAIAKAVIDECLSYQPARTLKRQDFMILAQHICQAFPSEEESNYFVPAQPNFSAKGKLWCAYNSKRYFLRHSGMAKRRVLKRRKTVDVGDFTRHRLLKVNRGEDVCIDFSENTSMDWDHLMLKWSETHELRRLELQHEKLTPSEYMDRYSILKSARGITLMEIDVHILHPSALTINNWLTLYMKVVDKAQGKMKRCETVPKLMTAIKESKDERYSAGLALLLIPYIFPHNGRKSELSGERATKGEIQQRFIKEYRSLDDLRADPKPADLQIRFVHSHRRVIYAEFGISGCIFQCADLMEALGCLFHYMMAMGIDYPRTCNHVWQFVQSAIFHVEVQGETLPFVECTINDLNWS